MERKPAGTKKVRKGDKVIAISGNSRGLTGIVQSRQGDRIVVQGLNVRKKHLKRSQEAPQGRIIEVERPIHVSNFKVCVEEDTPVKLKIRTNEQGDRQFIYNKDGQEVVYRSVKKPK